LTRAPFGSRRYTREAFFAILASILPCKSTPVISPGRAPRRQARLVEPVQQAGLALVPGAQLAEPLPERGGIILPLGERLQVPQQRGGQVVVARPLPQSCDPAADGTCRSTDPRPNQNPPPRASGILPVMMTGVGLDARLGLPFDQLRAAMPELVDAASDEMLQAAGYYGPAGR
jgi:hypothetical protein